MLNVVENRNLIVDQFTQICCKYVMQCKYYSCFSSMKFQWFRFCLRRRSFHNNCDYVVMKSTFGVCWACIQVSVSLSSFTFDLLAQLVFNGFQSCLSDAFCILRLGVFLFTRVRCLQKVYVSEWFHFRFPCIINSLCVYADFPNCVRSSFYVVKSVLSFSLVCQIYAVIDILDLCNAIVC